MNKCCERMLDALIIMLDIRLRALKTTEIQLVGQVKKNKRNIQKMTEHVMVLAYMEELNRAKDLIKTIKDKYK